MTGARRRTGARGHLWPTDPASRLRPSTKPQRHKPSLSGRCALAVGSGRMLCSREDLSGGTFANTTSTFPFRDTDLSSRPPPLRAVVGRLGPVGGGWHRWGRARRRERQCAGGIGKLCNVSRSSSSIGARTGWTRGTLVMKQTVDQPSSPGVASAARSFALRGTARVWLSSSSAWETDCETRGPITRGQAAGEEIKATLTAS